MPTPAAQYLRMSTEHQQYSLENQAVTIQRYAFEHGFVVTQTYVDAGRSGVVLNRREGLRNLLKDVVCGVAAYKIVLVYDVSRWGRFQDIDEAAHYEFVCRSSGIPIHYCAETFTNDGSLANMIMKALRRMMAAEYSRELSVKVFEGAKHLVQLGFRQGGVPGYGLRRLLVSPTRQPKQELLSGQRKSLHEDRVVLIPGPSEEVECVREIFRLFTEENKFPSAIAEELNRRQIAYRGGITRHKWYPQAINRILRHPKYAGNAVYGSRSQKLHKPRISMPRSTWTVTQGAWAPIVDQSTFDRAQARFFRQTMYRTDEQLLDELRMLWEKHGKVSERLLNSASDLPSIGAYTHRFGSLTRAFDFIGYVGQRKIGMKARQATLALRDDLVRKIVSLAPRQVSITRTDGHFRPRLRLTDGPLVSVYVLRSSRNANGDLRWIFNAHRQERDFMTLIARLDCNNKTFQDFYVLPNLTNRTSWRMKPEDLGLRKGRRLFSLADFGELARAVCART